MNITSSWLDALIVVALVGSVSFGFAQGFLRQLFVLLASYVGAALSVRYHEALQGSMSTLFPTASPEIARASAFAAMTVALTLLIARLLWSTFDPTEQGGPAIRDRLGGATVGGLAGILAISLTVMILQYSLASPWPQGGSAEQSLKVAMANSFLRHPFDSPIPLIQFTLNPWVSPGDRGSFLPGG